MGPLTENQVLKYHEDGYLLASGLIPEAVARRAEDAVWEVMEMDRSDPNTWSHRPEEAPPKSDLYQYFNNKHPDLLACYTPAMMAAMAQVTGEKASMFEPPESTLLQNVFPSEGKWSWGGAHFDGAVKARQHKTFPGPFFISTLIYLNDIEHHGGGTIGWPGKHKAVRALAESDPEKYEYLWRLAEDLNTIDLGEPVELEPNCGDIFFFSPFAVHSGSRNVRDTPRLALRARWPELIRDRAYVRWS